MKATETTVLNFIGGLDKVFIIPPFQRNYEWSIEQCQELFNDIVNAYQEKKSHYLGNIVYYLGKNNGASYSEFILVDGQQRVTTILILLCALRDSLEPLDNNIRSINNRYLLNDTGDNRFRVRLKQTSYDIDCFTALIDQTAIHNNDSNIIKNYNFLLNLIKNSKIDPSELYRTIPLLEIVDVNLQIENDLNAVQTVFEKINSTGKRLTPADLIRNYLLLSKNSTEQEKLYENYWVKIEQLVKNNNISKFARDYLIMNIFEDVPEAKIYSMFKEYFTQNNALHVDILKDMHRYSQYFSWIKTEACPDFKLNQIIKYLNYIKSDDFYPLYLYLFDKLYSTNVSELEKILRLICDFMIRFRVVSPASGGSTLRTIVQQLLEKLSLGLINHTYQNIYFELSNSSSPSGRFPDDEDFKNSLKNYINTTYAKTVLLRIEEYETKNIPVELNKVTVEHLMPQTLSYWWIQNLGGEKNAEKTSYEYLSCIGNLTPISQGYNSKISNKPWSSKIKELTNVQFKITTELSKYHTWKEEDIKKRNNLLANRACLAITGPLSRTRKYQSKKSSNDFSAGIYPLSNLDTPMAGSVPEFIIYKDKEYEVSTWKELLNTIYSIAYKLNSNIFIEIVKKNKIHKSTSKKNYPHKDPIISFNPDLLVEPVPIENSSCFLEGALSSDRIRFYAKQLLDFYNITDEFQFSVRDR